MFSGKDAWQAWQRISVPSGPLERFDRGLDFAQPCRLSEQQADANAAPSRQARATWGRPWAEHEAFGVGHRGCAVDGVRSIWSKNGRSGPVGDLGGHASLDPADDGDD